MAVLTAVVVIAMSALGFSGFYTFRLVKERIAISELLDRQTTSLQTILRGIAEIVLIPDNPQTVKIVRDEVAVFTLGLERLAKQGGDRRLVDDVSAKVVPEWNRIQKDVRAFLKISRPNPDDIDTMITFGKLTATTDRLFKVVTALDAESKRRLDADMLSMSIAMGAIALALIVSTVVVLRSISRSITGPLEEISESARMIALGNLKLELSVRSADEIGGLADSFRQMVASLRQMIGQTAGVSVEIGQAAAAITDTSGQVLQAVGIQNSAIASTARAVEEVNVSVSSLKENSRRLFDAASATSSAATELSASIAQVAENAGALDGNALKAAEDLDGMVASGNSIVANVEKLSRFAEESCVSMEQISSTIRSVQESAERSVQMAEQVSNSASQQGMVSLRNAVQGIEKIRNSVSSLSDVVNRLGSKSMQIGKIITVIDDIASQTRLLALNASILAAQAGTHGKSFSVVALEIRSLADRTFLSTREITDVITSVQAEADSSVKMAHVGTEAVKQGVTLIDRVREALESIHQTSLAATEMSRTISRETASEGEVISRVSDSILMLRDQIDEISRAVHLQSDSTVDMNRRMEEIKEISREIAVATREQSETGVMISNISDSLLRQSEDIDRTIGVQKKKSDAILEAVGCIGETSVNLEQSARTMEEAADSLSSKASTLVVNVRNFEV